QALADLAHHVLHGGLTVRRAHDAGAAVDDGLDLGGADLGGAATEAAVAGEEFCGQGGELIAHGRNLSWGSDPTNLNAPPGRGWRPGEVTGRRRADGPDPVPVRCRRNLTDVA